MTAGLRPDSDFVFAVRNISTSCNFAASNIKVVALLLFLIGLMSILTPYNVRLTIMHTIPLFKGFCIETQEC